MRSARLVMLLVPLLALAGCTFPLRGNEASAAPQIAPPPAACTRVDVTVSPATVQQGQSVLVRANLTNVCSESFQVQSRNGCELNGLDLVIEQGSRGWRWRGPDATQSRSCPSTNGAVVTVGPGETINQTWIWDGTFSDGGCVPSNGGGCGAGYPAPPGQYDARVDLMGRVLARTPLTIVQ